jgi:hypothetical protein
LRDYPLKWVRNGERRGIPRRRWTGILIICGRKRRVLKGAEDIERGLDVSLDIFAILASEGDLALGFIGGEIHLRHSRNTSLPVWYTSLLPQTDLHRGMIFYGQLIIGPPGSGKVSLLFLLALISSCPQCFHFILLPPGRPLIAMVASVSSLTFH